MERVVETSLVWQAQAKKRKARIMKKMTLGVAACLIGASVFMAGCKTTEVSKPAAVPPQPCKERLGTFKTVEFEHVSVADAYAAAGANQKAAKKIDELLIASMGNVFPGMKVVTQATDKATDKTLVIRPVIKEIKFIGGAARFWVGPMAGNSWVRMQVDYVDKATGNVIGNPVFYCTANAWGGGMSMGGADNMMLSQIVQDITTYTVGNK
jgi:hypothetical protein